jgi:formate dehydrogenase subunit delta
MDADKLIRMANRIGQFFEAMPDRADAVDGVATHLRKFWEPRMRRALVEHARTHGTEGMHPLVAEVVRERAGQVVA